MTILQQEMDAICEALSQHDDPCEDGEDALKRIVALYREIESLRPYFHAAQAREEAEVDRQAREYFSQQKDAS